jgi:hypothetical protein
MDPVTRQRQIHWTTKAARHAPWLAFVLFYALFANLPYWIVAREYGFRQLGWFCIQYAAVGLVALLVPRLLASVLLFLVIAADLLCGICLTFNLPIRECLANLRAAQALTGSRLLNAIAVGLVALLVAAVAALLPGKTLPRTLRVRAALSLSAFTAVILLVDCLSFHAVTGHLPDLSATPPRLDETQSLEIRIPRFTRIPIVRLVRLQLFQANIDAFRNRGPASQYPVPSATAVAVGSAGIQPGADPAGLPNLVLVVVESWGLALDDPLHQALVQPYLDPDLQDRYQVIQGAVSFNGPTIPGEGRELCGSAIGFQLLTASAADLASCLPNRLDTLGYRTLAVHGMSSHMFNRSTWYQNIGFRERWFYEQFHKQGLPDCQGAFTGTCDDAIAAWIGRRLDEDSPQPSFVHWMTLNSHIPVPVPAHLANPAPCAAALALDPGSALCSWYQLVANVHRSVVQIATGPLSRPTVFVIVGDHAPPFGDPALHGRFSQTQVPYVILLPRSRHGASSSIYAHNANPSPHAKPPSRQSP